MSRICIMDEREERPAPPFLQDAFEALGHATTTVFIEGRNNTELRGLLSAANADLFVAIQTVGFLAAEALAAPEFASKKIAVLFYDDPVSTYFLFGRRHPFFSSPHVHFFIWDGYWLRLFEKLTGRSCFSTHLAAETKHFSPGKKDLIPQVRDCVVFLGNIPSEGMLRKLEGGLPPAYQRVAAAVRSRLAAGPYAMNPFESLDLCLAELPQESTCVRGDIKQYIDSTPDFSKPLAPHIQLRQFAWQYGKRETRLRAMRAAVQAAPLAILSNLKDPQAAGEKELRDLLQPGAKKNLLFVDTSEASYYQLAHLYSSGRFHLQSTDPQSVEGGIPYRVFQCAACAVPLVSDAKKELAEMFKPDQEIVLYKNEADLGVVVEKAWKEPDRMRVMGEAAHRRFLQDHTWTHRMRDVLNALRLG